VRWQVYAELAHEAIGLCVAYAFYVEYEEIAAIVAEFGDTPAKQRAQRYALPMNFPNDRPRAIGSALLLCLLLAKVSATSP
jgi:hypothetical protein